MLDVRSELFAIVARWRKQATDHHKRYQGTGTQDARKKAITIHKCADELELLANRIPPLTQESSNSKIGIGV